MLFLQLALAASPEETALLSELKGRPDLALKALNMPETLPLATAIAVRYQLPFSAGGWPNIELLKAKTLIWDAAALAIQLLEEEQSWFPTTLMEWAEARKLKDPSSSQMLLSHAYKTASNAQKPAIENAIFRLALQEKPDSEAKNLAQPRSDLLARLVLGNPLYLTDPEDPSLDPLMALALARAFAAEARSFSSRPPTLIADALVRIRLRFPLEEELARIQLNYLADWLSWDPESPAAAAALEKLTGDPIVGLDVLKLQSKTALDPLVRYQFLRKLAERIGTSYRTTEILDKANEALIAALEEAPDAQKLAQEVLKTTPPTPALLYYATAFDTNRIQALLTLATRFPGSGLWCPELTEAVFSGQLSPDTVIQVCSLDSSLTGQALQKSQSGEALALARNPTRLIANGSVQISEIAVDIPALLQANTAGPVLDLKPSAPLLKAAISWTLPLPSDHPTATDFRPKSRAPLVAVSFRQGDSRLSALIAPDPVELSVLRVGSTVYVAAPGQKQGKVWARTHSRLVEFYSKNGIFSGELKESATLVFAQGSHFGEASIGPALEQDPGIPATLWIPQRPEENGSHISVWVIGKGHYTVLSMLGETHTERKVVEVNGIAEVQLWAFPKSTIKIVAPGFLKEAMPPGPDRMAPFRISYTPATGRLSYQQSAPTPPEGIPVVATNPLFQQTQRLSGELLEFQLPLSSRFLNLQTPSFDARTKLPADKAPSLPEPKLPSVLLEGQLPVPPADTWWRAWNHQNRQLWIAPAEQRQLEPGDWVVEAWIEEGATRGFSRGVPVSVVPKTILQQGRWQEKPGLARLGEAVVLVQPGDPITVAQGLQTETIQLYPESLTPELTLSGSLSRKEQAVEGTIRLKGVVEAWLWVQDGSGGSPISWPELPQLPEPLVASPGEVLKASPVEAERLPEALLQEEERQREASDIRRVDFSFDPALEVAFGASGLGGRGSASAVHGYGTKGSGSGMFGSVDSRPYGEFIPGILQSGIINANQPFRISLPPSVTQARIGVVARLPDGRWVQEQTSLAVEGKAPPLPQKKSVDHWNGEANTLVELAYRLPSGPLRNHALTALSRNPRFQLPPYDEALGNASLTLVGVPEEATGERIIRALEGARKNPELARIVLEKLLRNPELSDWQKAHAALALAWSDMPLATVENTLGSTGSIWTRLARTLLKRRAEPADTAEFYEIAASADAWPLDRALALEALTLLPPPEKPIDIPIRTVGAKLTLQAGTPLASWEGVLFARGSTLTREPEKPSPYRLQHAPLYRSIPITASLPPRSSPGMLRCWSELGSSTAVYVPSGEAIELGCVVQVLKPGTGKIWASLVDAGAFPLQTGSIELTVGPAAATRFEEILSVDERVRLVLAKEASPELLTQARILPPLLPEIQLQILQKRFKIAQALGEPHILVEEYNAFLEQNPALTLEDDALFEVAKALSLAHPDRSLPLSYELADRRFKQDYAMVEALTMRGLTMTAGKLGRMLLLHYPATEVTTHMLLS